VDRHEQGFSLIELLIVVAIILVIAAIAIPNLMSARRAANEASAVGSLRTINTAEASIQTSKGVFTCKLLDLGPSPAGLGYLDAKLALASTPGNAKSGYWYPVQVFAATCNPYAGGGVVSPPANPVIDYSWGAEAAAPGTTGINAWCTDTSMVIYRDAAALPTAPGSAAACASASPLIPLTQ
jgi:prepilin-type N-terminal cleavage/methylation domain-containing protein